VRVTVTVERSFVQGARKLPPERLKAAQAALVKFATEPALPSLRFRPLKGKAGYFIIKSTTGDRIISRRDFRDQLCSG
jgi:hypothetical protein